MNPPVLEIRRSERGVILRWRAPAGQHLAGFNVYRSSSDAEAPTVQLERLNRSLITPADGCGDRFELEDTSAIRGEACVYWIEVMDTHGQSWLFEPTTITDHPTRSGQSRGRG